MTELKLGWTDLEQADTRGRWWIVGSAFTGALAGQLCAYVNEKKNTCATMCER